jgi:putative tryptophan/tyrosine transport system substrate-binding protein
MVLGLEYRDSAAFLPAILSSATGIGVTALQRAKPSAPAGAGLGAPLAIISTPAVAEAIENQKHPVSKNRSERPTWTYRVNGVRARRLRPPCRPVATQTAPRYACVRYRRHGNCDLTCKNLTRRGFIAGLGGVAAGTVAAGAQQRALPVIGFLFNSGLGRAPGATFLKGLADAGYSDGRNVTIDFRSADDQNDRLPALARELVDRGANVIVASGSSTVVLAVKEAARDIPVVFDIGGDPVASGFVESFARPGRNMTGVTSLSSELSAKRLELLHETIPGATSIALLVNETSMPTARSDTQHARSAADARGVTLHVVNASSATDIEPGFVTAGRMGAGALMLGTDNLFVRERARIVESAVRHAMPTMHRDRTSVLSGGLISYAANEGELARQCGYYAGLILRGEKPADLPVHQPTTFELALNLKMARALGVKVPTSILVRADAVIE